MSAKAWASQDSKVFLSQVGSGGRGIEGLNRDFPTNRPTENYQQCVVSILFLCVWKKA